MSLKRWPRWKIPPEDPLLILLLLGLAGQLLWGSWRAGPPPPLGTPTAPQPVTTSEPKLGMHTRLSLWGDATTIDRTLTMVRDMGAPWVVEYFPWLYLEPRPGEYNWGGSDRIVDAALAQGLTPIVRLDGVPEWARPPGTSWKYLDRDHYDAYARFLEAFASRYRGRVDRIIVWNEPNLRGEWGDRPPDPAAYAELLRVAYPRLKQGNPDVTVLLAGLAPNTEPPGSAAAIDDLTYLRDLYAAGIQGSFDAFAVHAYGTVYPPDDPANPARVNFARTELVRQIAVEQGDAAKPLYVTEGGWNDNPRYVAGVRPPERIRYTLRAIDKARDEWAWCAVVAFWQFRTDAPTRSYSDNWTFVTPDFVPRPIYDEVRKLATGRAAPGGRVDLGTPVSGIPGLPPRPTAVASP